MRCTSPPPLSPALPGCHTELPRQDLVNFANSSPPNLHFALPPSNLVPSAAYLPQAPNRAFTSTWKSTTMMRSLTLAEVSELQELLRASLGGLTAGVVGEMESTSMATAPPTPAAEDWMWMS